MFTERGDVDGCLANMLGVGVDKRPSDFWNVPDEEFFCDVSRKQWDWNI